jgi:hypothetical protein
MPLHQVLLNNNDKRYLLHSSIQKQKIVIWIALIAFVHWYDTYYNLVF